MPPIQLAVGERGRSLPRRDLAIALADPEWVLAGAALDNPSRADQLHAAEHLARWLPGPAQAFESPWLEPLERVRRLTPPGSGDLAGTLELLAAA